jgi:urea transport system substrate-binding protein
MSNDFSRRSFLGSLGLGVVAVTGGASALLTACGSSSASSAAPGSGTPSGPLKVGVLTDLTGAFGVVGKANKAVAEFTIKEINTAGGVLGRQLEMVLVDSASDPAVGATVAKKLVEQDRVDMVIGGVASNMREAIKGIIAERGKTLYIWPASYEGGECTQHVWNVGAVPNQQVDPLVDKLLTAGAKTFFLTGDDYLYPRNILARVKQKVVAGGGSIVGEEYVPLSITDTSTLTSKVLASNADVLFEIVVLPATAGFIQGVVRGGFKGKIASTLFDEGINSIIGPDCKGLLCVQDYFKSIPDQFSKDKVAEFNKAYPDVPFTATFNSPDWYRGLYFWKAAVEKAGTLNLARVEAAFDSISYDKLIGGPAAMKAGTRHASLTMYIGEMQADNSVKILSQLGKIEPEQCG